MASIQTFVQVDDDEQVDNVYERLQELMAKEKTKGNMGIIGDWNAVVEVGRNEMSLR